MLTRVSSAFVYFAIGKVLAYVVQVVLARTAGPETYGKYAYAFGIISLIAVFASGGYNNSIIRFIPEYIGASQWGKLRGFLRTALSFTIFGGILCGIISFVVLLLVPHGLRWNVALIFSIALPSIALLEYMSELSRSFGDISESIIPNFILRPIGIVVVGMTWYLARGKLDIMALGLSIMFASTLALLGFSLNIPSRLRMLKNFNPSYTVGAWTAVSLAMILMVGFQTVLNQADLILVGAQINATSAGFYSIGSKVSTLASFALLATNQVFAPAIARLYNNGKKDDLQHELIKVSVLTLIPTILIGGLLYFGAAVILKLFGEQFLQAAQVLRILVIGQIVNAAVGPAGYVLNLTGNHHVNLRIVGTSAALNIVGCYLSSRFIGTLDSVALVSMSTMVIWNVWMHIAVVRRLGIWPSILGVVQVRCSSWLND